MKKIALVTGGTKGIGAGISTALKNAGYTVVANYQRDKETAEKFHEETGIPVFSWDVSDFKACNENVEKICQTMDGYIDVLINNAGITRDSMLHKMAPEAWNAVISTNLSSVFNMCRIVIPGMRDRQSGRIVNISSVNGMKGQVGQTNYSAAKAGIIGFTKALALESASKGITVNAVAPGYISTNMTEVLKDEIKERIIAGIPAGRFGHVDEIAGAVLFLLGEQASFITGATINVNGGQYL